MWSKNSELKILIQLETLISLGYYAKTTRKNGGGDGTTVEPSLDTKSLVSLYYF
jgi:hypothetical protein